MKLNNILKMNKRVIAMLMVLALIFNIMPRFPFLEKAINDIPASAATIDASKIKDYFDTKMNSLGWVNSSGMTISQVNSEMWHNTAGLAVSVIDTDKFINDGGSDIKVDKANNSKAVGYRVIPEDKSLSEYISYGSLSVLGSAYSGADGSSPAVPNQTSDENIYYTIEKDGVLGYYRRYYVSTADQLATLLYHYQKDFDDSLKAANAEVPSKETIASKLGIVLLNDIDLGGSAGNHWKGYVNTSCNLEIDGQGHTVYNGYFTETTEYFLRNDGMFAIHDVTFSNMFIGRAGGMFGSAKNTYFNNVNWENCLAANVSGAAGSSSIVFFSGYNNCHLKNCTIDNCYVTGNSHSALFASFNTGNTFNVNRSYLGDDSLADYIGETDKRTDKNNQGFYYTSVPDSVEDVERAWNTRSAEYNGEKYWLSKFYPSIYENCATVNSTVYDIGGEHSGTFISCMQSNIIFKNCFTNCTIYAIGKLGVFLGACIGSGDGFYYPYNGEKTFVNAYFENCYTSGSIEGKTRLGGFVGMIFDDSRAFNFITRSQNKDKTQYTITPQAVTHRGKVVFNNCYSTSSVGMQYAGDYVGGFAGIMFGNPCAENEDDIQHIFNNCYAAGEVGGIATETATTSKNKVGGFFGTYINYRIKSSIDDCFDDFVSNYYDDSIMDYTPENKTIKYANDSEITARINPWYSKWTFQSTNIFEIDEANKTALLSNCYYDKQTTAMRERDIGNYNNSINLCGSLKESNGNSLTGVYTKSSPEEYKNVDGLTDTVDMGGAWDNSMTNYYPQLKSMRELPIGSTGNDLVDGMYNKRREIFYNYAVASTATVLLDHYDKILSDSGELTDKSDAVDIAYIYDTVRDITRKFEFTTDEGNNIVWDNNETRNKENGFIDTIDSAGNGFKISSTISDTNGNSVTVEKEHNPDVLKIVFDDTDSKYKCTEFAPGRQWVTVTAGTDDTVGRRDLRLLPTAYLNAGGSMEVNIYTDETGTLQNKVTYENTELPVFNHSVGVAYALTDTTRMSVFNQTQTVSEYAKTDKSSFALYGGYMLGTPNSGAVGLNNSGKMYDQKFAVTGQANNSENGMTMVKVFNTKMDTIDQTENQTKYKLDKDTEITDADQLKKWNGEEIFDSSEDKGYYYLEYYWRLDDGRYLTDQKLVKIKSESHTVEMITGIINEPHTVTEPNSDGFKTAVDQYVTDEIIPKTEGQQGDRWTKDYPSLKDLFEPEKDDGTFYEKGYNTAKEYNGDTYYIKSKKITSASADSVVGWHRTTGYRLTTLIVEVQGMDKEWNEMARIDSTAPAFDFSKAEYKYSFSGYSVEQNPDTRLFTVTDSKSAIEFKVENSSLKSGIENFIEFSVSSSSTDTSYDSSNSIRVTALFRRDYADIQTEKYVLEKPESDQDDLMTLDLGDAVSFRAEDKEYEVDNAGVTDNAQRKAVLSGDTLTYRMRLYNAGYFDSDAVNVYDEVPEGCSFVPNSMKIYRQKKDITSGSAKYDAFVVVIDANDKDNDGYIAKYDNGILHWQIPTVELDYDYYVEYKVKVGQLKASEQSSVLENTAQWDFIMLNGDLDYSTNESTSNESTSNESTSIDGYKNAAIFDMGLKTDENGDRVTYEIKFGPRDQATEVTDMKFQVDLPDGFECSDIKVFKGETEEITGLTISQNQNNAFIISDFPSGENDNYTVKFTSGPPTLQKSGDEFIIEASVIYNKGDQSLGNSITKVMRVTNKVETDVTHLYLNVEKTIENADPSQTFMFRIERYEDKAMTKLAETFYTQIRCTDEQQDSGSRLVQVDKRGYYKVTEMTDWSATDYDLGSASGEEIVTDGYPTVALGNGKITADKSGNYVAFALPRLMYKSGAFPTSFGTLASGTYPTAKFTDKESEYAYLSGQAYAQNKISKAG